MRRPTLFATLTVVISVVLFVCVVVISRSSAMAANDETKQTPEPELLIIEQEVPKYVAIPEIIPVEVDRVIEVEVPVEVEKSVYVEVPCGVSERTSRYAGIEMTAWEEELLARCAWREARGEKTLGMRLVVEVVLNRVLSSHFPNTVTEVLYQPGQFTPYDGALELEDITPTEAQYEAVALALSETPITDDDVVFFATSPLYGEIFMRVGGHYFTHYPTKW